MSSTGLEKRLAIITRHINLKRDLKVSTIRNPVAEPLVQKSPAQKSKVQKTRFSIFNTKVTLGAVFEVDTSCAGVKTQVWHIKDIILVQLSEVNIVKTMR